MISEKSWEFATPRYLAFLDLEKAFDRVPRKKLWRVLALPDYNIPSNLQRAIRNMYTTSKSAVRPLSGKEIWFDITTGVRQGSILSPLLFVLLMDQVLKSAHSQQEDNPEAETLAYADDIGLITDSPEHLQQLLNIWNNTLTTFGLKLNVKKSEVMIMSRISRQAHMTVGTTPLNQVDQFKYLGSTYGTGGVKDITINDRIQKFSSNVGLLYPLLKDKHVPKKVKTVIYTTILRPVLLYGCESWTLTSVLKSKIQAAEMRVLRLIKGVTRRDRLRNVDIRKELKVKSILTIIEESQLRWYGHMRRMDDTRIPKKWFNWRPKTKRPTGRPRKRWIEGVREAINSRGKDWKQVEREQTFLDRDAGRAFWTDSS